MKPESCGPTSAEESTSLAEFEPPLPKKSVLAWLLLVPFLLAFLGILFFFDIAQRIAMRLGGLAWQERMARGLNYCVLKSLGLLGTRLEVEGTPDIEIGVPHLIVSNHQSMFDLVVLYTLFARLRPRYVAKLELGRGVPSISFCLRTDGSALIDRRNPKQAIPAIRTLGSKMNEGKFATILFPEGTRARQGKMKQFRPAGFAVLLDSVPEARIVPVALDGTWKLTAFSRGPIPTGVTIRARLGTALDRSGKSSGELLDECYERVRQMLEEIRQKHGC